MDNPRYLIGQGENLSEAISRPQRNMGDKVHPYSFDEARRRLAPQWEATAKAIDSLPTLACPGGNAALEVTLHPSYLAKSYYPSKFMRELGLYHLGSRAVHIVPETVIGTQAQESGKPQPAPVFYLAGNVERLLKFSNEVAQWMPDDEEVKDAFRRIESVAMPGRSRLKTLLTRFDVGDAIPLEAVLHNPEDTDGDVVLFTFGKFMQSLGLYVDWDRKRQVGGLAFLPITASQNKLDDVLKFSFLRALREAPRIVPFDPTLRSVHRTFQVILPNEDAVAPDLSVAIFDGGLPENHGLDRWVTLRDAPGVGAPVLEAQQHGLEVTSSFLFGPIMEGQSLARPYANVDHWRVYGDGDIGNNSEALDLLDRIEDVLESHRYDFINISLGPDYSLDDDDISLWTARLDQILASGETVATIAGGNNGERDRENGFHRVQPPADGVNMLAVGASDGFASDWRRAPYSACGPGRSPGYVKPDFLTFGGSSATPFLVLNAVAPPCCVGKYGHEFCIAACDADGGWGSCSFF